MYRLLCTAEFDDVWTERFRNYVEMDRVGFSLDKDPKKRMKEPEIIQALKGYDIHISGYEKLTREVLYQCPDLKLILSVRDGPGENIDIEACTELGIPVLYSSGRCERAVPEFVLLTMMMLAKPVERASNIMRTEKWTEKNDLQLRRINEASTEMAGKTVGIIGLGRNGAGVAIRCDAFQMKLLGYDPYISKKRAKQLKVTMVSLEELFEKSDFVVILARVTKETQGIVTKELIKRMKKDACFINTARATLVDNKALLEALKEERIRAALDVFEHEPLQPNSELYEISRDRLLLTPHLAGVSQERIVFQSEKLYKELIGYLKGENPVYIANPEVYQSPNYQKRGEMLFGVFA